jgi:demethylmenaquinone methyltransferase/2-methoxy-6-polyprenyl-1,4-benzoquinol methylase
MCPITGTAALSLAGIPHQAIIIDTRSAVQTLTNASCMCWDVVGWFANMNGENEPNVPGILPVHRTRREARQAYDTLSRYYGYTIGAAGRKYATLALQRLSVAQGETVLEIGFGTGHCLKLIAESVGRTGRVCGIDISPRMIQLTRKRLDNARLSNRVELYSGDATCLPFSDQAFNAVFMSFALEVVDTSEIPRVLEETSRVLEPRGRLGVVSMSKENGESIFLRLYEWVHNKCPKYVGSRPIYAEKSLIQAGLQIQSKEKVKIFGLPAEIIVAVKSLSSQRPLPHPYPPLSTLPAKSEGLPTQISGLLVPACTGATAQHGPRRSTNSKDYNIAGFSVTSMRS